MSIASWSCSVRFCLDEKYVMLGFSYLFFIFPWIWSYCVLVPFVVDSVLLAHVPPHPVQVLQCSGCHYFIVASYSVFIHLLHTLSYWQSLYKTQKKCLILVMNSNNIMERYVNPLCLKLILSKGALVIHISIEWNSSYLEAVCIIRNWHSRCP